MNLGELLAGVERHAARALMRMPRPWMVRLVGGRRAIDGFVLDDQIALALAVHSLLGKKPSHELGLEGARLELERSAAIFAPHPRPVETVQDRAIPGPAGRIPVRVYHPRGARRPGPALVFLHGGGFLLGSLASHDAPCRALADEAHCVVVSVDYRLAPEHRFPAAVEDAVAAFRWVAAEAEALGVDPARIAIGGDSAGGNLAAVVALETRGDARRPCFQILLYPATDMTMSMPSVQSMGKGFFLERETMFWFRDHYLRDERDRLDPRASPLFTADVRGAPPAFVATAGFDPLRDEGKAYADKLREAGVPVGYRCYPSLFHGFFSASGSIEAARCSIPAAAAALRGAFA